MRPRRIFLSRDSSFIIHPFAGFLITATIGVYLPRIRVYPRLRRAMKLPFRFIVLRNDDDSLVRRKRGRGKKWAKSLSRARTSGSNPSRSLSLSHPRAQRVGSKYICFIASPSNLVSVRPPSTCAFQKHERGRNGAEGGEGD